MTRKENISIHALLAEGDVFHADFAIYNDISIHALLAEGDDLLDMDIVPQIAISIHALLAEGDRLAVFIQHRLKISIHALLAEGDWPVLWRMWATTSFLSTPSSRRATW